MTQKKLHLYSIMPLDIDHIDEICEDIRAQYESGVATCALFSMTLVPEGNPPANKVELLCAKYKLFRDKLKAMGIGCGILVQASVGHGWKLSELFPYQQYTQLLDGKTIYSVCPADEGFREYISNAFSVIASSAPDHIMLDDDFRLLFRQGGGCACPLHLKRFEKLTGNRMTREALLAAVREKTPEGQAYADAFVQTQKDSLMECATVMRQAIDNVDPSIPGSFCCVGTAVEFGAEIAAIMAGKGHPRVIRINNANYTPMGAKYFSRSFLKCAASIAKLKDKVDVILAETDTCPQNRYSTGARSLHTHFTGSILEGANGAKHWITRLATHEPQSGKAYRNILGKHSGFYQTLADLVPTLRPRGFRIPVSKTPQFPLGTPSVQSPDGVDHWSQCVLERMGLPLYFSHEAGGVACMEGNADKSFTDAEILEMLKGKLMLASDTAANLIARGFGKYLGADVRPPKGKTPTNEFVSVNGGKCNVQVNTMELVPTSDQTRVDSMVCHSVDKEHYEPLFPGSVVFDNTLGGRVITFAGTPKADFNLVEAFSFLTYSRKLQLTRLLQEAGELPLYYPGDEEVYLRVADMEDGSLFCAIFNLSCDPIEELTLSSETHFDRIERLLPDGSFSPVGFARTDSGAYHIGLVCEHLYPVVLKLSKSDR